MVRDCSSTAIAGKISWCCALLTVMLLVSSSFEGEKMGIFMKKGCDEIYVVREGETLNTISEKCGDPFIVERNPHIHDPDDVFPGLVIMITNSNYG
ncbi:uncharacterized protein [Euphorbia lathyris]|uniref:uncharacterized protein n=1 Tax=Euphorbia lathyris TaxID=212925 RepID=UPI0033132A76